MKLFLFLILSCSVFSAENKKDINSVLVHPVFNQYYSCIEHWDGQFDETGDALGTDCIVQKLETVKGRTWLRSYKKQGSKNEEWYSWQQDVLAPIDGTVEKINENAVVNEPGVMGKGAASFIIIRRPDGISVLVAHVSHVKVHVGDIVSAGQVIAKVGNNGQSRHPHVHVGAWKNNEALQLRFDQTKIKGL